VQSSSPLMSTMLCGMECCAVVLSVDVDDATVLSVDVDDALWNGMLCSRPLR